MPLPDCIEDSFLSWLTRLVMLGWLPDVETTVTAEQESCEQVMRSFNRAYPLHLDLEQEEADRCSDSVIECIGDALDDERASCAACTVAREYPARAVAREYSIAAIPTREESRASQRGREGRA